MVSQISAKALVPNPSLKSIEFLVGGWNVTRSHPYLPGTILRGLATYEWHEGGAFLIMHSEIDHPKFPDSVQIYGSDDQTNEFFMLSFDERGVWRKYNVAIIKYGLRWWHDDPNFSQRFTITTGGSNKMVSNGEMSRDGSAWERDLELTYERSIKKF